VSFASEFEQLELGPCAAGGGANSAAVCSRSAPAPALADFARFISPAGAEQLEVWRAALTAHPAAAGNVSCSHSTFRRCIRNCRYCGFTGQRGLGSR
jgi:hypothetical protein